MLEIITIVAFLWLGWWIKNKIVFMRNRYNAYKDTINPNSWSARMRRMDNPEPIKVKVEKVAAEPKPQVYSDDYITQDQLLKDFS